MIAGGEVVGLVNSTRRSSVPIVSQRGIPRVCDGVALALKRGSRREEWLHR